MHGNNKKLFSFLFLVCKVVPDGKIALVGYCEFVAQHFLKLSKSSKNVQKSHTMVQKGLNRVFKPAF